MFAQQYWSHIAPDGTEPWKWFSEVDYNYADAGENLAKNFRTAEATTEAWMNSAEHRDNILNSEYQDVGFAVMNNELDGKPTTVVVALFGHRVVEEVAGARVAFVAADNQSTRLLTRFGVGLQAMTQALLASLLLLSFTAFVALLAHAYRHELPKILRQSWYRHHGAIKAAGMFSVIAVTLFLYGGGQI